MGMERRDLFAHSTPLGASWREREAKTPGNVVSRRGGLPGNICSAYSPMLSRKEDSLFELDLEACQPPRSYLGRMTPFPAARISEQSNNAAAKASWSR